MSCSANFCVAQETLFNDDGTEKAEMTEGEAARDQKSPGSRK